MDVFGGSRNILRWMRESQPLRGRFEEPTESMSTGPWRVLALVVHRTKSARPSDPGTLGSSRGGGKAPHARAVRPALEGEHVDEWVPQSVLRRTSMTSYSYTGENAPIRTETHRRGHRLSSGSYNVQGGPVAVSEVVRFIPPS